MAFEAFREKLQGLTQGMFKSSAAGSDDSGYGMGDDAGNVTERPVAKTLDTDNLSVAGKTPVTDEHEINAIG